MLKTKPNLRGVRWNEPLASVQMCCSVFSDAVLVTHRENFTFNITFIGTRGIVID
jgi:hypothetical protein